LEGLLEAADRNCEGSVEELIEEKVNADGHSNAEGGADASRESENVDKQVEGEATCGILQLEEKLGNGVDSSCDDCISAVVSYNEGVELPVGKAINEAVPDMCELEEVTENTSQETVQGEVKDGVSICTLHSLKPEESDPSVKSSLEHNVQAEVATVDETAAESDLKADNVVEVETAAREVEETEVKDEADLAPFLSQQNCESSTETVEHEKIEAPSAGQPNVTENDVAEVEPTKEHEREVVDAVPLQEASTFHNEPRSIDLVDSDNINHSSSVTELESCDHVHTEESRSREISETAVEKLVSGASLEHGTMVRDEAEITPETENGSQEEPSDAAVDHGEPVELKGELEVDDAQLGSTTGYDSLAFDTAGSISEKDESSETVGGSKSQEKQSEICNTSTTSDELSATIGNEVPSPINEVDETCNGTCPENVNVSIKSSEEVETKCLEGKQPFFAAIFYLFQCIILLKLIIAHFGS
jgi:hypothetical protein